MGKAILRHGGRTDRHAHIERGKNAIEPDANTKFFAVQAASFSVMSNARGFLQRLRSAGYDAFLSTGKVDAGLSSALTGSQQVMHRVVVGPLLSRSRAEQIRDELQDKLRVEARIVAMRQ